MNTAVFVLLAHYKDHFIFKPDNLSVANALQLEAVLATPALSRFN